MNSLGPPVFPSRARELPVRSGVGFSRRGGFSPRSGRVLNAAGARVWRSHSWLPRLDSSSRLCRSVFNAACVFGGADLQVCAGSPDPAPLHRLGEAS